MMKGKIILNKAGLGLRISDEAVAEVKRIRAASPLLAEFVDDKILRTDSILIKLIDEWGSERVSAPGALLKVETFDKVKYNPEIGIDADEHEILRLVPIIYESQLSECRSMEDTVNCLRNLGLKIVKNKL